MIQSSQKDWQILRNLVKCANLPGVNHCTRRLYKILNLYQSISDAKNAKLRRDENCESQG